MSDKQLDNNQVSALLNAYSISDITTIFGEIDQKIFELHECSSEDFLTLNAYFKKYYSDSKTISSNASFLFNLITNEESKKNLFLELRLFHDDLREMLSIYENLVEKIITSMGQMIREMDQMFVTANNLKQDLMTLKLLVTNLKLDVTVSVLPVYRFAHKINDFNDLIVQTKSFFIEFYKRSNTFKESLRLLNEHLVQQRDRNLQNINEITYEIGLSTNLLDKTYNDALPLVPKLTETTTNTSDSIAKIITNLQYQDIIRQKIDHIQQTHKDIIDELTQIKDSDNDELNLETRVKCFIQIRDVAGLQAAQLIHTNKEYQKAIEAISGKFLEVGADMTNISDLCHQLIGNRNGATGSHYDEIKDKLEKTAYFNETFEKSLIFLKDKTLYHQDQLSELINNYDELSDFLHTIEKSINRSMANQSSTEVEQFETTVNQIKNILNEIQNINTNYQQQFCKINNLFTSALYSKNGSPFDEIETKLRLFSGRCVKIIDSLYENNENVYKIIGDNQVLSKRVSSDIKASIEQIKYYDFFDKVIEEIIGKLNDINMKLQNIDINSDESRAKHLEFLKSRYTMESEHIIHDHLTKNDVDLTQLSSTGTEEDDDNLELF